MTDSWEREFDRLLLVNQWAQSLASGEALEEWLESHSLDDLPEVVRWASELAQQASPSQGDADAAILAAPFRSGRAAAVILGKGLSASTLRRLEGLTGPDARDAARLLLEVFRIADGRRCLDRSCRHWWHGDLASETYLRSLRLRARRGQL